MENGVPVLDEDGNPKTCFAVVDENNVIRSTNLALMQYADIILSGASIILDAVNITTKTASATLELPSLGLKALSYAKYVKAGPKMVSYAGKELKEINDKCKQQRKEIRAFKNGFTESGELKDPDADLSNIDEINFNDKPTLEKEVSVFNEEITARNEVDATIPDKDAEVDLDIS